MKLNLKKYTGETRMTAKTNAHLLMILIILLTGLAGCSNRVLTMQELQVERISDPTDCRPIKVTKFGVNPHGGMLPVYKYAAINTNNAGGNSYLILSTSFEHSAGIMIRYTRIGIYRCDNQNG